MVAGNTSIGRVFIYLNPFLRGVHFDFHLLDFFDFTQNQLTVRIECVAESYRVTF